MRHSSGMLPPDPREEAIPILNVADAERAALWYRALGFEVMDVHRFAPDLPAFVTIARETITLFLSEHDGDARPGALVFLRVRDVRALAASLGLPCSENPWGPDVEVTDPDGNRLRIGTPSWW